MQKVVTFGEIMLRLATPGYKRFIQSESLISTFGGGEANVAVSLANYGIPVEFVTRLPKNDIANWCISDLRKYGVGTRHILRGGERVGPMPWTKIMATGGVEPTKESITAWFKAGVTCVGIGSKLFPKEVIENGNWEKITQLCRECISIIQQTR
jgi:2-dehydro-3-deoxygluconokinase